MKQKDKERLKKYQEHLDKGASKFKLKAQDLSNLYDLMEMITWQDYEGILKANKLDEWFDNFHRKIQDIVINDKFN